jgi:hypothetical protein
MKRTKKKGGCRLITALAVMVLLAGQAVAGSIVSKAYDAGIALRVKNSFTGDLSIVVATNGEHIVITCDGNATTLTAGTSYDTISELAAGIAACTNTSGDASLTVNAEPSLAADSTDEELLDGTYTAVSGKWLNLLWDTSAAKHYSVYLPSRTYQTGVGAYRLSRVVGEPTGTGNVTLSIYKGGTLINRKVITSPVYVIDSTTTNATADNTVNVDWDVGIPFGGDEAVIVRAARATTATTGILGAVIDPQ